MTKDEALDKALEFIEANHFGGPDAFELITAIKQARALDKKAENARELGLDYEPAGGTQVSKVWWDGEKLMAKPIPLVEFYKAAPTAQPAPMQEPVAWTPIDQPYPPGGELDILMGDGSILCEVLPQSDGDLWWGGASTGERFIDPKYASVTHWRIHSDTTPPAAQRQWVGLTDEQIDLFINGRGDEDDDDYVEPTGDGFGLTDADLVKLVRRAEAKLKERNI